MPNVYIFIFKKFNSSDYCSVSYETLPRQSTNLGLFRKNMNTFVGTVLFELQATKVGDHPILVDFLGSWPPARPQNGSEKNRKNRLF